MSTMYRLLRPHYKATLCLGLPIAIGQLGVIIMGFADTMMVGRYSTEALASASFVNNLFTLVTFLLMGYSYGLTPLVSAECGRGDYEAAGRTFRNALAANAVYGALLLAAMGALYFALGRMGQPREILPLVRPYYLIILWSMLFVMLFNVLRQFTDATTDTAAGMWCLLAGNGLNVCANYLLIYGIGPFPEMGLLGAGVATLLSRIVSVVLLAAIIVLRPRYAAFRRGFRAARCTLSGMWRVAAASLPVSLQMGMETGSFTFSAIMAGWMGQVELASFQVLVTVGTLGFLLYYSFGAGMSIRIAAFFGKGDLTSVRHAALAGSHLLAAMAVAASLVFLLFARQLVGGFTTDVRVVSMSLTLVVPLVFYQFGDAMQICFANALRGTSHVVSMMWIAFVSYVVVGLPAGYLLSFPGGMGLRGLFLAFSLGLFTAAALFFGRFRRVVRSSASGS